MSKIQSETHGASQDLDRIVVIFGLRWFSQTDFFEDSNMTFFGNFFKSTFQKAFIPEVFSSLRSVASFETDLTSKSSILVEFGTFDCGIVFLEYVIAKFSAKSDVFFRYFLEVESATCQVATSKVVNFHQWPEIFHRRPEVFYRWTTDGH